MHSEAVIVYFGVRIALRDDEVATASDGTHPILRAAKLAELEVHICNEGEPRARFLLVGRQLAWTGEAPSHRSVNRFELEILFSDAEMALGSAGISGPVELHIKSDEHCQPVPPISGA
jgi:hypothetical protein